MKQNIELMNQIYKNFYGMYESNFKTKFFGQPYVSVELYIEKEVIKFTIAVPQKDLDNVDKMISSFYPGAVIEPIPEPKLLEAGKYAAWGNIVLSKSSAYPLKTYENFEADPMDSILSTYSKIEVDEKMCFQVLVSPSGDEKHKKMREEIKDIKEGHNGWRLFRWIGNIIRWWEKKKEEAKVSAFTSQQEWDLDKKVEDEMFDVRLKVLCVSPVESRVENIVDDFVKGMNQYNYVGLNSFVFKKPHNFESFIKTFVLRSFYTPKSLVQRIIARVYLILDAIKNIFLKHILGSSTWNSLGHDYDTMFLNIKELSSLIHFPNSKFNRNPRIRRQNFKIMPAPDNIPTEWILLGYNNYGWVRKEIRVAPVDRFRHFYIIGQTGTGKSTALLTMAQQDIPLGNGFCLIDPHGDLCEHILKYIPKERIDDLIYFDFANTEYPIGFNVFEADTEDERDIVTNDITEMFVQMYGHEIFGPRIQDYFRNASFLLMEQPEGGTLVEIMRLFTDEAFLDSKLRNLQNPVIRSRWTKTYKSMGDREKQEIIPFLQAKFWPFTTWVYVRNVIGQPKSGFRLFDAMNQKKIILCNLSKWLTGEINSQLIGRMFSIQIKLAALKRAAVREEDRVPFFLYVDEFQNYVSQSFESVLSEARKYRLGLCVAHQYIEQLKNSGLWGSIDLSKPIFGNVGNQLYYKVWPEDAEFLEKNVSPEFNKNDLVSIDARKGVLTLSVNTQPTRPFSIEMHNPYAEPVVNSPEKVAIIKQISALKRGTKRELVDKEIFYRVGV